jgi:CRISPR system Cascade subunit CasB
MNVRTSIYSIMHKKVKSLSDERSAWARASLARLRRGVGKTPGSTPDIWEVTLSDLPEEYLSKSGKPTYVENAVHTALTLFALHQQGKTLPMSWSGDTDNQGAEGMKDKIYKQGHSLGRVARLLVNPEKGNESAIKRRFDAAVTSRDAVELSRHARGLIQLARAKDITLDYPRFAWDLYQFQVYEYRESVLLCWGQDFWNIKLDTKVQPETEQKRRKNNEKPVY